MRSKIAVTDRVGTCILVALSLAVLVSCGGGGQSSGGSFTPPTITSVSVACNPASVQTGQTSQCTATVAGTGNYSSTVTWSASTGSINSSGLLTAPSAAGNVTVTATSTQDTTKSGTATVSVTAPATITSVSVSCNPTSVQTGQTSQCTATVAGTGSYSSTVTWSASAGTINSSALLTAPSTAGNVTVTATSTQDTTKSGTATVNVTAPPTITSVSVSCNPTSVQTGQTSQCTATVAGTGNYSSTVTWSASAGTINSSGLLTAPSTAGSVTVTATSTQDTTKSGTATVNVTAPPTITSISVSCNPTSVQTGQASQCTATVAGTGNYSSTVTWSASAGTINSSGLLTAPSAAGNVTVTATSTQDTTKSGTATVNVTAPPTVTSVSVSCNPNSVQTGQTSQCTASVAGTGNYSSTVTWSASAGTINSSGLLTASSAAGNVTVTAISTQDTTKSGTATVNVTAPPTVTSVSVSCNPTSVQTGQTSQCTASVTGTGNYSSAVTWSVNDVAGGNSTLGTISSSGLYTGPATVPSPASVTVTATSQADSTESGSATVSVTNPVPSVVSVNPTAVAITSTPATFTVNGEGFVSGCEVNLNSTPLTTSFVSSSQVTAQLPPSSQTVAGSYTVTVTNPSPGGGKSTSSAELTLVPTISGLSPSQGTAGSTVVVSVFGADPATPGNDIVVFTQAGESFSVAASAAAAANDGSVHLTVTTPGGLIPNSSSANLGAPAIVSVNVDNLAAQGSANFEVVPPPHALGVSPGSTEQGTSILIALEGVSTAFDSSIQLSADNPGISFSGVTVSSGNLVVATITVASNTPIGNHVITASDAGQQIPFQFTVLAASTNPIALTSLSTTAAPPFSPLNLTGSGFSGGGQALSSVLLVFTYAGTTVEVPCTPISASEIDGLVPVLPDPNTGQLYVGAVNVQVVVNGLSSNTLSLSITTLPANTGQVGATTLSFFNMLATQLANEQASLLATQDFSSDQVAALNSLLTTLNNQLSNLENQVQAAANGGTGTGPDGSTFGLSAVDTMDRLLQSANALSLGPASVRLLAHASAGILRERALFSDASKASAAASCQAADSLSTVSTWITQFSWPICLGSLIPGLGPVLGPLCGFLHAFDAASILVQIYDTICNIAPINLSSVSISPSPAEMSVNGAQAAESVVGQFQAKPSAITNGAATLVDVIVSIVPVDKALARTIVGNKVVASVLLSVLQDVMNEIGNNIQNTPLSSLISQVDSVTITSAETSFQPNPNSLVNVNGLTLIPGNVAGTIGLYCDLSAFRLLGSLGDLTSDSTQVNGNNLQVQVLSSVVVSPASPVVQTGGQIAFSTMVLGTTNQAVTWAVDGVVGGDASSGTISVGGLYSAPNAAGTHTITATSGFDQSVGSATVTVQVAVSSLSFNPTSIASGAPTTGTITVSAAAPTGGVLVGLSSGNASMLAVPSTVEIGAGLTTATFTATASSSVAASTQVSVTASYSNSSQSATVTVAPLTIATLSFNPTSVAPGGSTTGTVTVSAAAPTGGALVTLSSNNTGVLPVPANVTVPAGSTTATFTATASASVTASTQVTVTAAYGGSSQPATVTVSAPDVLASLSFSPTLIIPGTSTTGTVTLSTAAPTGGALVTLSSNDNGVLPVPANVTVPAGSTTATFTAPSSASVTTSTPVTVTATYNNSSQSASVTVTDTYTTYTYTGNPFSLAVCLEEGYSSSQCVYTGNITATLTFLNLPAGFTNTPLTGSFNSTTTGDFQLVSFTIAGAGLTVTSATPNWCFAQSNFLHFVNASIVEWILEYNYNPRSCDDEPATGFYTVAEYPGTGGIYGLCGPSAPAYSDYTFDSFTNYQTSPPTTGGNDCTPGTWTLSGTQSTPSIQNTIAILLNASGSEIPTSTYSFAPLHSFSGAPDGATLRAGLVMDAAGNLYGATQNGGDLTCDIDQSGCGTVFKVDTTRTETVLHSFTGGADGIEPKAGLVQDAAGNLYGTTFNGGAHGYGTVFKLDPTGTETVLYSFTGGVDGASPLAGLVMDAAGDLYGTTQLGGDLTCPRLGGPGCGTLFKVDTTGAETVLHSFTGGADGLEPTAELVQDAAGNLYGTTSNGGAHSYGTVFKLNPTGTETVLYSFTGGADGASPLAGLVMDAAGNLYGTTQLGGAFSAGTVFEVSASGAEIVLYSFTGGSDGSLPEGGLLIDAANNLYGTTDHGGDLTCGQGLGCGTVFKLDKTGKQTVLYTFSGGTDGAYPQAGLVMDAAGNLYGTASGGGDLTCNQGLGCGTVFKLTPLSSPSNAGTPPASGRSQ